jgi:hypothetical protein
MGWAIRPVLLRGTKAKPSRPRRGRAELRPRLHAVDKAPVALRHPPASAQRLRGRRRPSRAPPAPARGQLRPPRARARSHHAAARAHQERSRTRPPLLAADGERHPRGQAAGRQQRPRRPAPKLPVSKPPARSSAPADHEPQHPSAQHPRLRENPRRPDRALPPPATRLQPTSNPPLAPLAACRPARPAAPCSPH